MRVVPALVGGRARPFQRLVRAHRLHRVVVAELPRQVVAADEVAQARVEGPDVVVLEVDLDEGLPVVVALVHLDLVEHVAREVQQRARPHRAEIGRDVAPVVLEHQAVPGPHRVVVQVQAGVLLEVRRAHQLAVQVVGPAVQRADDVAARVAAALQHHGLTVAADVGDEFHAVLRAHQCAAFAFLRQGIEVADLGHRELMPEVPRTVLVDQLQLATIRVVREIGAD
jgi:hypothetical protein